MSMILPATGNACCRRMAGWLRRTIPMFALLAWQMAMCSNPVLAGNADKELYFDPSSGTWKSRPAGDVKNSALRRWANMSPIPREIVAFDGDMKAGSILIRTAERRLYLALGNGKAVKYGIGVGREGFAWKGTEKVSRKAVWPAWTPPPEMRAREAKAGRILPARMEGGVDNPLGARALYLGSTYYRIHGTNEPWTIGKAVSSGCIRMANEDVIHLFDAVKPGASVVVE